MMRRLAIAMVLLACIVLLVACIGREMVASSPVYEQAKHNIQERYGARLTDLSMPLLSPFKFSEGDSIGSAEFVLCDADRGCYDVQASKKFDKWELSVVARDKAKQ